MNIHESPNEEVFAIFITNKDFNKTKKSSVTKDDDGNCFELSYSEKVYITTLIYSWYLDEEEIHISIMKNSN